MVKGNIWYAIHYVHLPSICQDINHKERVTNITKSRAVLRRHSIKMHLMYVRSITYTYLKHKRMGLCSKNGTISPQWKERQPNSFMWSQVLLKTVKHGVTVTADVTEQTLQMALCQAVIALSTWYGYTTSLATGDKTSQIGLWRHIFCRIL